MEFALSKKILDLFVPVVPEEYMTFEICLSFTLFKLRFLNRVTGKNGNLLILEILLGS